MGHVQARINCHLNIWIMFICSILGHWSWMPLPVIIMKLESAIQWFRCLYWLVKYQIVHNTSYGKLPSLAQLLGSDYFFKYFSITIPEFSSCSLVLSQWKNMAFFHFLISKSRKQLPLSAHNWWDARNCLKVIEELLIEQMSTSQAIEPWAWRKHSCFPASSAWSAGITIY